MTVVPELASAEQAAGVQRRRPRWPFVTGLVVALALVVTAVAWARCAAYGEERARADAAAFSTMVADMPVPAGMREDPTLSSCVALGVRCFEPTDADIDAGFATVCAAVTSLGADLDCAVVELPGVLRQVHGTYGRADVVLSSPLDPFVGGSEWESIPGIGVAVYSGDDADTIDPSSSGVFPSDLTELSLLPDAWVSEARCAEPVAGGCRLFKWEQRIDVIPTESVHRLARHLDDAGLYVDHVRCKDDGSFCTVGASGFLEPGARMPVSVVVGFSRVGERTRLLASVG